MPPEASHAVENSPSSKDDDVVPLENSTKDTPPENINAEFEEEVDYVECGVRFSY